MTLPPATSESLVLVTGAASGIGRALAAELASRGYPLALADIQKDRLGHVADELAERYHVSVDVHHTDLASDADRENLVAAVRAGERTLVAVCNNAGIATIGPLCHMPYASSERMVRVNAEAVHHLTLALLPDLLAKGRGSILNVASMGGHLPVPNAATYAATKAFVLSLSEALHTELRGTGVTVSALCPVGVATDIRNSPGVGNAHRLIPPFLWGSPQMVAQTAVDGMISGKRVIVPGRLERAVITPLGRYTPHWLSLRTLHTAITMGRRLAGPTDGH